MPFISASRALYEDARIACCLTYDVAITHVWQRRAQTIKSSDLHGCGPAD